MRSPVPLSEAFGAPFEELLSRFAYEQKLIPEPDALKSTRFISRSVIPHVRKLSALFNREEKDQAEGLGPYWKTQSNPANVRLAYFLSFMPGNLYRIAAIWAELHRLGFKWAAGDEMRGIELGAGPASGACGIAAGEHYASVGLPKRGHFALIEQDKATLQLGSEWAKTYFAHEGAPDWGTRLFHRKVDFAEPLLPRAAPKFNLWVMSFFLNEETSSAADIADRLVSAWERHLEDEGVVILCEPALRLQSRRLLELRREILARLGKLSGTPIQLLLPCLGHQACGALAVPDDWCHEEVTWWRPPYFRIIDKMVGLDRKTLPFSYLVFARSKRSREELLPALAGGNPDERMRLVSPAHKEGRDLEFFVCSASEGKKRARYLPKNEEEADLQRGDILKDSKVRGDTHASRIERMKKA